MACGHSTPGGSAGQRDARLVAQAGVPSRCLLRTRRSPLRAPTRDRFRSDCGRTCAAGQRARRSSLASVGTAPAETTATTYTKRERRAAGSGPTDRRYRGSTTARVLEQRRSTMRTPGRVRRSGRRQHPEFHPRRFRTAGSSGAPSPGCTSSNDCSSATTPPPRSRRRCSPSAAALSASACSSAHLDCRPPAFTRPAVSGLRVFTTPVRQQWPVWWSG
jgi:hypothetical protein